MAKAKTKFDETTVETAEADVVSFKSIDQPGEIVIAVRDENSDDPAIGRLPVDEARRLAWDILVMTDEQEIAA